MTDDRPPQELIERLKLIVAWRGNGPIPEAPCPSVPMAINDSIGLLLSNSIEIEGLKAENAELRSALKRRDDLPRPKSPPRPFPDREWA